MFEIIICNRIQPTLCTRLSPNQHGFFPDRSTVTNLMVFTDFISGILDAAGQVDALYTDLAKAFDRIDHSLLLRKLSQFGCSWKLVSLLGSYLDNRQLCVMYNRHTSDPYCQVSGVPQGSNLGPLLYINDLCDVVSFSKCLLFADDLKIFASITTPDDANVCSWT